MLEMQSSGRGERELSKLCLRLVGNGVMRADRLRNALWLRHTVCEFSLKSPGVRSSLPLEGERGLLGLLPKEDVHIVVHSVCL